MLWIDLVPLAMGTYINARGRCVSFWANWITYAMQSNYSTGRFEFPQCSHDSTHMYTSSHSRSRTCVLPNYTNVSLQTHFFIIVSMRIMFHRPVLKFIHFDDPRIDTIMILQKGFSLIIGHHFVNFADMYMHHQLRHIIILSALFPVLITFCLY